MESEHKMTREEVLRYCFFYKGEVLCPQKYLDTIEGELWQSERFVCEEIPHKVSASNPRVSLAEWVCVYTGKWDPYDYQKALELYLEKVPEAREAVERLY